MLRADVCVWYKQSFPCGSDESTCNARRHSFNPWVKKSPLEKGMAIYSSILTWRIPWAENPGAYST